MDDLGRVFQGAGWKKSDFLVFIWCGRILIKSIDYLGGIDIKMNISFGKFLNF